MTVSLGPHVIGAPGSLAAFLAATQCGVVKYLDPPGQPLLTPLTIGRIHYLSEEKDLSAPLTLAKRHADIVSLRADETGIKLWEGINEPPVWNGADYIARLCEYEAERCRLLNARGLGAVVLNLSVGWPRELEDGTIEWTPFSALLGALAPGNFLGLHEYWYPTGPRHADSYRHRAGRFYRCPYAVPIVVTECGVDIGGGQNDGWRAQGLTAEQYATQLADYRAILEADPLRRVRGATVFTYGNVGSWQAFDLEPDWTKFVTVMTPSAGGQAMGLIDYPVPDKNNGFGWHYLPALADVAPLDKTVALLKRMQGTGAMWVKLITSPGGDTGWERGATNTGACEMTFCAALDLGFGVVVRIFNSWAPAYITPAIRANLRHLCELAVDPITGEPLPFYVECANEIDAEANRVIDDDIAEAIVTGICDFIDACWEIGGGQIIPVWPSFGYGRTGRRNWFQIAHDLGRGACLDRCAVAVHNYASANRLFEPWDPDYVAGTPLTQAEYDAFPWRFGVNVIGENPRLLADINAKRRWNAAHIDESEFASGWYTYRWTLRDLDALGHTETPLVLTETGTRVGEMVDWEPRVDPLLHAERTLDMIADIRQQPRIIMSGFWLFIGKAFAPIQPTWEDQCCISPTWDRRWNTTMPDGEYAQIETPGQLPLIDDLETCPVSAGKGETPPSEPPTEPPDEPEPPEVQPMTITRNIDPNTTKYELGTDGKVAACPLTIVAPVTLPTKGAPIGRVTKLQFIGEASANLTTVMRVKVFDVAGQEIVGAKVRFSWPRQKMDNFDGSIVGTTEAGKGVEFALGSYPTASDPLGPYVVELDGVASERVVGGGLPDHRHVGDVIEFTECTYLVDDVVTTPEPEPEEPPDEPPPASSSETVDVSGTLTIITVGDTITDYVVRLQPK